MGSLDKTQDEITVLITGFGPFKSDFPRNPSWDIASSLPEYLPLLNAKAPTSARASTAPLPPVRIVTHPEPVRVTYSTVLDLVPKLWQPEFSGLSKIDYVLHIGMASTRPQYCVEQLGHRDDYKIVDLDNKLPPRNPYGADWPWEGVPSQLSTDLDTYDIRDRWEKHLPEMDYALKVSHDAGHFLCDFTYFNSLAYCFKAQQRRQVVFLHVPASRAEPADQYTKDIDRGREVVTQLIRSIVESELARPNPNTNAAAEL